MTRKNAYVIGPVGELYKCWHDIGNDNLIVGKVDNFTNWNMTLISEGLVEGSYLDSSECKQCSCFPICDGGCQKTRVLEVKDGKDRDNCSYFKEHLAELLEVY